MPLPANTKIGRFMVFLCPVFPHMHKVTFSAQNVKKTSPPQVTCWNTQNPALEKHILKTVPYMRILKSLNLNSD